MIKGVIFDMDGLMIDSEPLQSKAFEYLLGEYGKKPTFNKDGLIQIVGITAKDNLFLLKEKHNLREDIDKLLKQKEEIYEKLLKQDLKSQKGLFSLIKKIKTKGLKLGIASSSPLNQIKIIIERLGLINFFDAIVSGTEVTKGKPHPDVFLKAARELKVSPQSCLVLEDAESGVEAGKRAKMKVIAVPNQYTKSHDFSKADLIIHSLEDIKWSTISNI